MRGIYGKQNYFFEKVKIKAGEFFILAGIKKAGIGILICAVIAGAGG